MSSSDDFGTDPMYFPYPTLGARATAWPDAGSAFLENASDEQWSALLDAMDLVRFAPGDVVLAAGAADRALYLLIDGRVRDAAGAVSGAPATLGAVAFLAGRARSQAITADTHGEALRLDHDALETLAARDPHLGRAVLAEVARLVAERFVAIAGAQADGAL